MPGWPYGTQVGEKVVWGQVVLDGEELDPPPPLTVLLHKPTGYVVTSPDDENIPDPVIYDLLPYRWEVAAVQAWCVRDMVQCRADHYVPHACTHEPDLSDRPVCRRMLSRGAGGKHTEQRGRCKA